MEKKNRAVKQAANLQRRAAGICLHGARQKRGGRRHTDARPRCLEAKINVWHQGVCAVARLCPPSVAVPLSIAPRALWKAYDSRAWHASTHSRARCRSIFRPHILRARAGRLKRLSWRHNAASADQPAGGMRAALCLARRRRLRPLRVCAGGWPGSGCEASRWNMPTASAPHHHACGEARPGGHAGDDGKEEDD